LTGDVPVQGTRELTMTLPFILALSGPPAGCHIIQSDTILARDIAAVVPAFASVREDFHLGYVPLSGAPRILRGSDLERFARNQGLELTGLPDVCLARQAAALRPSDMEAAMRTALSDVPGIIDAKIVISSWSLSPAPTGELVFPRSGMQLPSGTQREVLWRGYVRHAGGTLSVWARVRITVNTTRVVATANLPGGKAIQKNQVRVESCEESLLDETTARHLDEVIGYIPRSSLRAFLPIPRTQLAPPPDIAKGEIVDVQVLEGAAHLTVQGRAQTDGVTGSLIWVRNLSSGKDFRARVAGKNQVVVGASPAAAAEDRGPVQ
jgi:flagella basal body P-ring formation protein FlgA